MLTKHLLTISLLLPLVAMSATAHAGSTITDKSYWPSKARQSAQIRTVGSQSGSNSALAYDRTAGSAWQYQGRPESQMTHTGGRYSGYSAPAGR